MNTRLHTRGLIKAVLIILLVILLGYGSLANETQNGLESVKAQEIYKLGCQQMANGKYQEAISSFQAAIWLNKDHVSAHAILGWAYFTVLEFDKARAQWEEAIALDPKSTEAHLGIGYLHFMADEYNAAVQSFEAAISADPKDSAPHAAIGRVYHKKGLIDKAIAALEKSIELNPNEITSYWVLGEIYEEKGMPKEAQDYKDKARAIGEALMKKNRTESPVQ